MTREDIVYEEVLSSARGVSGLAEEIRCHSCFANVMPGLTGHLNKNNNENHSSYIG